MPVTCGPTSPVPFAFYDPGSRSLKTSAGTFPWPADTVLADLAALGFDARWRTLRASDIGAAHQRDRLFLLTWPADTGGEGLARWRAERPAPHRDNGPAADPVGLGGHRGRACGPGRDEPPARRLAPAHAPGLGEREPADQTHPLPGSRDTRPQPGSGSLLPDPGTPDPGRGEDRPGPARHWGRYAVAVARWEAVLGRPAPGPADAVGRLNPAFVEWLMGLPQDWVTGVPGLSRTAQLKALGNGVIPAQATRALHDLLDAVTAEETADAA
jgi:DNA (cytosine-5)-methyltransferase 1